MTPDMVVAQPTSPRRLEARLSTAVSGRDHGLLVGVVAAGTLLLLVFALNISVWVAAPLAVTTFIGLDLVLRPSGPRRDRRLDQLVVHLSPRQPVSLAENDRVDELGPGLDETISVDLLAPSPDVVPSEIHRDPPALAPEELQPPVPLPTQEKTLFTTRNLKVLHLMDKGCSNREIAVALYISPKTVPHHTKAIFDKLGVNSRTAAIAEARRRGIIQGIPHPHESQELVRPSGSNRSESEASSAEAASRSAPKDAAAVGDTSSRSG